MKGPRHLFPSVWALESPHLPSNPPRQRVVDVCCISPLGQTVESNFPPFSCMACNTVYHVSLVQARSGLMGVLTMTLTFDVVQAGSRLQYVWKARRE
jgi:hypothetical protein